MGDRGIDHVTCLGCGCSCDDVTVTVRENRIVGIHPSCALGRAWFGDGQVPGEIRSQGRSVTLEEALTHAAAELTGHGRCLVYLAPDVTSQAQRAAVAIADLLNAGVDCATSSTAAQGLLTAQRRGRASATLGELRNRGDVFLFWGVNPLARYPRFLERYALEPIGTHVANGRRGRQVIAVSIGADESVPGADLVLTVDAGDEIIALSLMRASILGHDIPGTSAVAPLAREIAGRLAQARYAVVVHDAEPTAEPRNPLRAEALMGLTQALNGPTRAALCGLRAGGNRVGAEAVLTWQTGYPLAVDFRRGYPQYTPGDRGVTRMMARGYGAALVVGSPVHDDAPGTAFSEISTVVIGPRASEAPFTPQVVIDTGIAGIHEAGTAYRMDEVPLRLRPFLDGPPSVSQVLTALHQSLQRVVSKQRP
jgi:formylmethanofuran dehydrogenase subunit B